MSPLWRPDGRCGTEFLTDSTREPGQCDPEANANMKGPCCSSAGYCGNTVAHCDCPECFDYSKLKQNKQGIFSLQNIYCKYR